MSVRMRHTKGHTANRRSHHALKKISANTCPKCGTLALRHRACENCGTYKDREVIDVMARLAKQEKKVKAKAIEKGESAKEAVEKEKEKQ